MSGPREPRNVQFRTTAAPNSGSHRNKSDSGVGSLSDQSSHGGAYPDRRFTAKDVEGQRFDVHALQDALEDSVKQTDSYKAKAYALDRELSQTRKDLREKEAQWRGLYERTEQLEGDKKKLFQNKKQLEGDNKKLLQNEKQLIATVDALSQEKELLRKQLDDALATIRVYEAQYPTMTGALPRESSKPHRSASKREKDKAEAEKKRLSRRFESREEGSSETSGGSTGKPRPKPQATYVEPFGPGPEPRTSSHKEYPPSPTRNFDIYVAAPNHKPSHASRSRATSFSAVPRSSAGLPSMQRPCVEVPASYMEQPPFFPDYEDGNYNIHPLPAKGKKR